MDPLTRAMLQAVKAAALFSSVFLLIGGVALLIGHSKEVAETAAICGGFSTAVVMYFSGRGDTRRG